MAATPSPEPVSRQSSAMEHWAIASKLAGQGRWADAASHLQAAVVLEPNNGAMWSDLGAMRQSHGDLGAAAAAYEQSLALAPQNAGTIANYSFLLVQQGRAGQAIEVLEAVLRSGTATALNWSAAGHAYRSLGDEANAVSAFRQALALAPSDLEGRQNLALALRAAARFAEAEEVVRGWIGVDARNPEAWHQLGMVEQAVGRMDQAIAALIRSVELAPEPSRHSSLLLALQYAENVDSDVLLRAHQQWDVMNAGAIAPLPPRVVAMDGDRPLRIGFVSSQFGLHPVGFLALRAIECLNRTRCEVVCYAGRSAEDDYTRLFRAAADLWRVTTQLSAEQLAQQIRADDIDILIDLMGHTSPSLMAFAYRPAPLQVSWLGYVGTTGMRAMDCLLADAHHVRPGEEVHYVEQVLRMPHGYVCYGPPDDAAEVNPLPALRNGYVTFGCFNNPAKFSPGILQAWAEILKRVPQSQLLLKYFGLDDAAMQRRSRDAFATANVAPERIVFEGGADHAEMLASYGRVDVALDTQPYSGGLTTCEALWMGVPVITYPGKTFAGRHSVSHMVNSGVEMCVAGAGAAVGVRDVSGKRIGGAPGAGLLPAGGVGCAFIAENRTGYVERAVDWAGRLDELALIRATLREQMRSSPLCDAQKFAEDFLRVLREAWLQRVGAGRS